MTKTTLTKVVVPLVIFLATAVAGMTLLKDIIPLEVTVPGGALLAFAVWIYLDLPRPDH